MFKTPADYPLKSFKKQDEDPTEYAIDLKPYCERFSKKTKIFGRYKIFLVSGHGNHYSKKIYSDADFLFILCCCERNMWRPWKLKISALACIGFDHYDQLIHILQIQGVKKENSRLKFLKWERMLVAVVVDWARARGFKKISIRKAEQNYWYPHSDINEQQRFKMRYDITAKRSGFKFDQKENCYVMRIAQT